MPLDPQAQKLLDMFAESGLPPAFLLPIEGARERLYNFFVTKGDKEAVFKVEDMIIPEPERGLPVRVYTPGDEGLYPILVFFHGGGWSLNNVETHDAVCRSLANDVDAVVVSVDYRLAPEHKFPAAIEDAYTAVQWVAHNASAKLNGDPNRIAVGGDSSGGTQVAAVCLLARDRGGPDIMYQWLVYPATDYYLPGTPSYEEMATGYSLDRDFTIWLWTQYLPAEFDLDNPYLFPLKAKDFTNLPPAFVMTANFDPLRDEGELYAKKLHDAGVEVTLKRYEDQMHGFIMQRPNIDRAVEIFEDAVAELRKAFGI